MLQKELTLLKHVYQNNVRFVAIGFFKDVGFKFEERVWNGYHDLLTMAYFKTNIAILSAKVLLLDVYWWVLVKIKC